MEGAMHAVDDQRLTFAHDVEHALHAQQLVAPRSAHRHQPAIEAIPVQRLVEGEAEGADVGVVARAVMMVVMVMMVVRLGVQPSLHAESKSNAGSISPWTTS
jgi:hypothetical protein